jgi:hypothetical protein
MGFSNMKAIIQNQWKHHHVYRKCEFRTFIDDDSVIDIINTIYPEALEVIGEIVATPQVAFSMTVIGPISDDGFEKVILFSSFKKVEGVADSETGYALIEVRYHDDMKSLIECTAVLAEVTSYMREASR